MTTDQFGRQRMTKNECKVGKNPKIILIWKGPTRTDQLLSRVHLDSPTVGRHPSCELPYLPAPFTSIPRITKCGSRDIHCSSQSHLHLCSHSLGSCKHSVCALCGSPGSSNLPGLLQFPLPLQDVPVPELFSSASDQINTTSGFQR